ncbi:GNAT family N-acetyltransferase [Novosphingobium sp. Gsoil 351]|uniref:GNAT family N-acetyltransferase n=1 Tax=Novosphingobium sp. Gsoil 351 TaxID=2675225 RepID=UPI0012B4A55D|nr:GNAT family N-acetyltransferase [Novosphingobium sp. Gsoil 351]QGN54913.1 GNAT family N-acetyltransferase [Novosphingobium sp. Gsoil 351]
MSEFRLVTDRLILRSWREADRDPFFALNRDPAVMEFLPETDRAASNDAVDRMQAAQAAHGHCFWAVERQGDGAFLGFCGPMPAREPLNEVELGWRLCRAAWGQGYASEAARASLAWCWANLATPTVMAITVPANVRSRAVMERIGMTEVEGGDFDHPHVPEGDPLRRHVLYRIARPA